MCLAIHPEVVWVIKNARHYLGCIAMETFLESLPMHTNVSISVPANNTTILPSDETAEI